MKHEANIEAKVAQAVTLQPTAAELAAAEECKRIAEESQRLRMEEARRQQRSCDDCTAYRSSYLQG